MKMRKKIVRFYLIHENHAYTIDNFQTSNCIEIMEYTFFMKAQRESTCRYTTCCFVVPASTSTALLSVAAISSLLLA